MRVTVQDPGGEAKYLVDRVTFVSDESYGDATSAVKLQKGERVLVLSSCGNFSAAYIDNRD